MSSIYEQEIKGQTYLYRSTSSWDKEKKQSRSKKVYLGKKDPSTGKLIPKSQPSIPTSSQDIGSLHLLKYISKRLGLIQILKKSFPDDYEQILYLSFFKIITKEPYYLYPLWQCRFLKKNLLKLLDKSTRIRLVLFYTQPSTKE